jgi:5-methylcytosine-specific restriction endonuclease McrA
MSHISAKLRQQVAQQANGYCEYCYTNERMTGEIMELDHIIPRSQQGISTAANLAYSCHRCNLYKSDQTTAIDPQTNRLVVLFNPRQQTWTDHFLWSSDGCRVMGRTNIGRATALALAMNDTRIVAARALWVRVGWHPPRHL